MTRDWYAPTTSEARAARGARPAAGTGLVARRVRRVPAIAGRAEEPDQPPHRAVRAPRRRPATREAFGGGRLTRYAADLVVPDAVRHEVAVLKGVAARYVMLREGADRRVRRAARRSSSSSSRRCSPAVRTPWTPGCARSLRRGASTAGRLRRRCRGAACRRRPGGQPHRHQRGGLAPAALPLTGDAGDAARRRGRRGMLLWMSGAGHARDDVDEARQLVGGVEHVGAGAHHRAQAVRGEVASRVLRRGHAHVDPGGARRRRDPARRRPRRARTSRCRCARCHGRAPGRRGRRPASAAAPRPAPRRAQLMTGTPRLSA